MATLDEKINQHFAGLVVRKDLVKEVKGNAIVPSYVLEYLLGQYCATSDEATIQTGIDTVKGILQKHYVHRNEAGLVRSTIKEKGRYKIIDKISVSLNDKTDAYEAEFSNLGIKEVLVDSGTVKAHPKLLVSGIWCLADVEYEFTEDRNACPWILSSLKPIQLSHFDFDTYVSARSEFTLDEWIDLLMQSIGYNPKVFSKRGKLLQLTRLIPFCERNYNLIELGPKGTGKSHIFSEFSPHAILISGGEVTAAKLFVNNATGKIGLLGYWDVVAFDEFAGKQKRIDKGLVDIMKNYMANKSFSRGIEQLGAEASMVFVGNTQRTVDYMLKHTDLFDELPDKYRDSAFLDRLHYYVPGWEVEIIRGEMFSGGYGFVVDYLAEVLRALRGRDYGQAYSAHFELSKDIATRDRDAIVKTFSGLTKILYPDGEVPEEWAAELLSFAIEGRKRVKDQLLRLDQTYAPVRFSYTGRNGEEHLVHTLEEGSVLSDSSEESGFPSSERPIESSEPSGHEVLGNYELLEHLRGGGMCEAYKARCLDTGDTVFLKRVRRDSVDEKALKREMDIYGILQRTEGKHVLNIMDVVRDDNHVALVTEFADGGDLQDYVARQGASGLSLNEVKDVSLEIARGIAELHENHVVHRDLKPENVLRKENAWKLGDFGIAKSIDRIVTQGTFLGAGTPGYWAPEQREGVAAKSSMDIYSLGKIMTHMLTGQTDPDMIIDRGWLTLVKRCTEIDPEKRPSIDEVIQEIEKQHL